MKKKVSQDAKKTYGFSLNPSLVKKVKEAAWEKRMSVSAYVQDALESFIEREEKYGAEKNVR